MHLPFIKWSFKITKIILVFSRRCARGGRRLDEVLLAQRQPPSHQGRRESRFRKLFLLIVKSHYRRNEKFRVSSFRQMARRPSFKDLKTKVSKISAKHVYKLEVLSHKMLRILKRLKNFGLRFFKLPNLVPFELSYVKLGLS